jgi:hypothetical protein
VGTIAVNPHELDPLSRDFWRFRRGKQKRARIADFRCREKQIEVQSKEDEVDTGSKQQTRS